MEGIKCSYIRKSERRKNNAGTVKEEENKLAEPLTTKELPAEGCSRRNGKWEESWGRRISQIIDNIMINGLYEDMKGRLRRGYSGES